MVTTSTSIAATLNTSERGIMVAPSRERVMGIPIVNSGRLVIQRFDDPSSVSPIS
jgi:hypothetical protein